MGNLVGQLKPVIYRCFFTGREFVYGSDNVFLSGTNPAWIHYGNDFGNNQWEDSTKDRWTQELEQINFAGGNTARVWIHTEGDNNPEYDSNGYVVGTDAANTLISDLR